MKDNITFESCITKDEAKELLTKFNAEPNRIISENRKAFKARCLEIRKVELAPYHDEAKRWRKSQKVYFSTGDNLAYMSFETMQMTKTYDIKPGQWCYVWQYQPRAKVLWLCHPGKKCEWNNIIDHAFTLSSIERCKISRTEPELRI